MTKLAPFAHQGRLVAGRRILITGASSGIGRALAEAFLVDGAAVAVCARRGPLLETLCPKMSKFRADVAEPADVDGLIRGVEAALGGLDAVINNAGVLEAGRLTEQPLEQWSRTLDVNLTGPLLVARAASRLMKRGCVVNVTSGLGFFPMEPYHAYCVSKAGLNMLTRALAAEWEGRIAVNAVDPGTARTAMNPSAEDEPAGVYPVVRALVAAGADGPTGRCFKKSGEEAPWAV
ncbi:MAG: SDR family oxidoreductase [Elusimicrobia bacterium]|nr:SDR family oxidoreductase [Elusimicrobiota bacterium]